MTTETTLSPAELKRQGIIDAATRLFRDLLGTHIDQACIDATEVFTADKDAEQPQAKMGFTVAFEPNEAAPVVTVKVSWSAKRSDEAEETVNDSQAKLEFPAPADAKTETPGAWLSNAKKKEGAR
jgi:hypothetical protein